MWWPCGPPRCPRTRAPGISSPHRCRGGTLQRSTRPKMTRARGRPAGRAQSFPPPSADRAAARSACPWTWNFAPMTPGPSPSGSRCSQPPGILARLTLAPSGLLPRCPGSLGVAVASTAPSNNQGISRCRYHPETSPRRLDCPPNPDAAPEHGVQAATESGAGRSPARKHSVIRSQGQVAYTATRSHSRPDGPDHAPGLGSCAAWDRALARFVSLREGQGRSARGKYR